MTRQLYEPISTTCWCYWRIVIGIRASHATTWHSDRIFFRLTITVSELVTCPTQRRGKWTFLGRATAIPAASVRPLIVLPAKPRCHQLPPVMTPRCPFAPLNDSLTDAFLYAGQAWRPRLTSLSWKKMSKDDKSSRVKGHWTDMWFMLWLGRLTAGDTNRTIDNEWPSHKRWWLIAAAAAAVTNWLSVVHAFFHTNSIQHHITLHWLGYTSMIVNFVYCYDHCRSGTLEPLEPNLS